MVLSRVVRSLFSLVISLGCLPCAAETVLLDFSSASCGPCQQVRPSVRQLAAAGYRVREVDIDREPHMATRYGVDRVPTFIVLTDGREAARLSGTTTFAQLKEMMDRCIATSATALQPGRAPIIPLGQSPDLVASNQDLSVPQPGRILAIEDPNPPRTMPQASRSPLSGQPMQIGGSATDSRRLLEATVKVAVEDPDGTSAGTGTMVDARSGEALILTCGHLFRSSAGKGAITVTLYQLGPAGAQVRTSVAGNLIHYDLDRDLALVSVRPGVPVQPVAIGSKNVALAAGTAVMSVGCNNGQNPTVVSSTITTVDRYQGFPNVQVAGAPVEGRSGGGLFDAQGQLIGVCYAADLQDGEGLYASLPSIHAKLDSLQLSMVYQAVSSESSVGGGVSDMAAAPTAPPADLEVRGQNAVAESPPQSRLVPPNVPAATPKLSAAEQAALEELQSRGANSEVICIIRPHSPQGKSEVITLQSVSPEFIRVLTQGAPSTQDTAVAAGTTPAGRLTR